MATALTEDDVARSLPVVMDWEVFSGVAWGPQGHAALGSRGLVRLSPSIILAPQLHDVSAPPTLIVLAGRGAAHMQYLQEEVLPVAQPRVDHVVLVDAEREEFQVAGMRGGTHPVSTLPDFLNFCLKRRAVDGDAFQRLHVVNRHLAAQRDEPPPDVVLQVEAYPLRLWEVFFMRGHAWRYELLNEEVPLAVELPTTLAANRALMQCVHDAQQFCAAPATEELGWIRVGRFRMRQREALLDVRVRMLESDLRVVFPLPPLLGSSWEPPTLPAVLMGSQLRPLELRNGLCPVRCICPTADDAENLAQALAFAVRAWCQTEVALMPLADAPPPELGSGWRVLYGAQHVEVQVPMHRHGLLPWKLMMGDITPVRGAPAAPAKK
ncbi:MAG: hypothetical protein AB2A00_11415 [Myxococcota bacterium]